MSATSSDQQWKLADDLRSARSAEDLAGAPDGRNLGADGVKLKTHHISETTSAHTICGASRINSSRTIGVRAATTSAQAAEVHLMTLVTLHDLQKQRT